jgi:hypothetical protein
MIDVLQVIGFLPVGKVDASDRHGFTRNNHGSSLICHSFTEMHGKSMDVLLPDHT